MSITPNPLEIYVSEPNKKLIAKAEPAGGTFTWTSSDPSKLAISGSGSEVTVKGLDEGDITVRLDYSPPYGAPCFDRAAVKVKYEVRRILVAQGVQFNNAELATMVGVFQKGDARIPDGCLNDLLKKESPFPLQVSGTSATFKSVPQGVKYIIDVTTDKSEFKEKLETPGKPESREKEYWHVIYAGHSRYGRGACFGTSDGPGEAWENGDPFPDVRGLYRMTYPFIGVPVFDILHHGYHTDVISTKVPDLPAGQREFKGALYPTTLDQLVGASSNPAAATANNIRAYLETGIRGLETKKSIDPARWTPARQLKLDEFKHCLSQIDSLGTLLRIVGDAKPMIQIGDPITSRSRFWGYPSRSEGPLLMLQAHWKDTVSKPMDLGATDLKCRVFCHFGCSSYKHFRSIVRYRKNWRKKGKVDRFAYFTSGLAYMVTPVFWLYHLLTFNEFNAGRAWEPSLEYARKKANRNLRDWCTRIGVKVYEIW